MSSVYVAWASGVPGFAWLYEKMSHVTEVASPGMTPSVGPTAYVLPLSQMADTVRCVGVDKRYVKFHAKVMTLSWAIL